MIKYEIQRTSQFKKDYKTAVKRGCDIDKLKKAVTILASGEKLPDVYRDHALSGKYGEYRECHIEPDWLLIYKISENVLILTLYRTGTHSDLF
ncbi:MAG: type II toxin-antitoxin system YafQ family toxin [Clostridiales bacterium]|nr:type II toxin-antitoxin system YafQ family toxin [Clostridiales bacterium]